MSTSFEILKAVAHEMFDIQPLHFSSVKDIDSGHRESKTIMFVDHEVCSVEVIKNYFADDSFIKFADEKKNDVEILYQ